MKKNVFFTALDKILEKLHKEYEEKVNDTRAMDREEELENLKIFTKINELREEYGLDRPWGYDANAYYSSIPYGKNFEGQAELEDFIMFKAIDECNSERF